MEAVTQQFLILLGVLAACFIGPTVAIAFLIFRKRRARALRKSPIGLDLLRGPGHSLREQLDEANTDLSADVYLLLVIPMLILSLFLLQGHFRGLQEMMHLVPMYVAGALAVVVYTVRKLWIASERSDHLKAGFDAELAVGQELDQLMRQGAAVFHDIPAENFNIDHVVISTNGVFAVETKGFTKPKQGKGRANATVAFDGKVLKFPTWTTKDPLEQAERQAAWLARWLQKAVGNPVHVLPVVSLPGWFVERTGRGEVRVFNGKELAGLLKSRGTTSLSSEDVQRVAHQIDQRCRTVAPRYSDE